MQVLAEYPAEEILPLINSSGTVRTLELWNGDSYRVRLGSLRLRTFKHSQECAWCGIKGNFFRLERQEHSGVYPWCLPHLNLYYLGYLNSSFITCLLTQDHVIPRSLGGPNTLDNSATLCRNCNGNKGALLPLQFVLKQENWPVKKAYREIRHDRDQATQKDRPRRRQKLHHLAEEVGPRR